jgi:hypothetical protein
MLLAERIQDILIGIATDYGLDERTSIPGMSKRFFLLHSFYTGFGAHPTSYPMDTGGSFPGSKPAGA